MFYPCHCNQEQKTIWTMHISTFPPHTYVYLHWGKRLQSIKPDYPRTNWHSQTAFFPNQSACSCSVGWPSCDSEPIVVVVNVDDIMSSNDIKSSTRIISNTWICHAYQRREHLNMKVVFVCFVHAIETRTNVFLIEDYNPVPQGFIFLRCSFCRLKNHCITRYSATSIASNPSH